jgi:protein-tyrosine-phosphatase
VTSRSAPSAAAARAPQERRFRILFVCTGNIHRSAAAELAARFLLDADAPVDLASAGTGAVTGHDMGENTIRALGELGIPTPPHAARPVEPVLVSGADLILTADAGHAAVILENWPAALRRTFRLLEFARLAATVPTLPPGSRPDLIRAHVTTILGQRGLAQRPSTTEDLPDPVRADYKRTLALTQQIVAAVGTSLDALGLAVPGNVRR